MREKVYVKCKRKVCGYMWAPKPTMWQNNKNKGDKMFKCPRCAHPTIVPKKVVDRILKNNC